MPLDTSNFQYGLGSFTKQDTDPGKYNILGTDGTVLGVGYDDVRTAAEEIARSNAMKSLTPQDYWETVSDAADVLLRSKYPEYGNRPEAHPWDNLDDEGLAAAGYRAIRLGWGQSIEQLRKNVYRLNGQTYSTLEEAQTAAQGISMPRALGGALADWEQLGQALNGAIQFSEPREWGTLPGNGVNETITGENTLYGSTPVFQNGVLVGYKTNLAPGEVTSFDNGTDKINGGGLGYSATHSGRSHSWATGLGRTIDPTTYRGLVDQLDGSNVFVSKDNASKLPGWTNVEAYNHQDTPGNWGVLGQVFDFVDPTLDKIDPMHNKVQEWTTGSKETAGQRPYFETIAPAIIDGFFPGVGTVIGGINSATKEDGRGVAAAIASLALPDVSGFESAAANAAVNGAIRGGVSGALQSGGDWEMALKAALAGGVSGGVNASVGEATADLSPLERTAAQIAAKAGVSGVTSELRGGDFSDGLVSGAINGVSSVLYNQARNLVMSQVPGIEKMDSTTIDALTKLVAQQLTKKGP